MTIITTAISDSAMAITMTTIFQNHLPHFQLLTLQVLAVADVACKHMPEIASARAVVSL